MKVLSLSAIALACAGCVSRLPAPKTTLAIGEPSTPLVEVNQGSSLDRLKAELPKLSPQEAGTKWAKFFLHRNDESSSPGTYYQPDKVLELLPAPESWPAVAKVLEAEGNNPRIKLFAAMLIDDRAKQDKYIEQMMAVKDDYEVDTNLLLNISIWQGNLPLAKKAIDRMIKEGSAGDDRSVRSLNSRRHYLRESPEDRMEYTVKVPDLSSFGKDGEDMYLSILKRAKFGFDLEGSYGRRLLIAACRKSGATLPIGHPELIRTIADADLYPLIRKWFPKQKGATMDKARTIYVLSKVMSGSGQAYLSDAPLLSKFADDDRENYQDKKRVEAAFGQPEIAKRSWDYLATVLKKNPKLKLWAYFGQASFSSGKIQEMIPILRTGLAVKYKDEQENYANKYQMAEDLVRATGIVGSQNDLIQTNQEMVKKGLGCQESLTKLGQVLGRNDLIDQGLGAQQGMGEYVAPYYIEAGRYDKAIDLLKNGKSDDMERAKGLGHLVHAYFQKNRDREIIALLDDAGWDAADLKDIGGTDDFFDAACFAQALSDIGRVFLRNEKKDLGTKMLIQSLYRDPSLDDSYEALIGVLEPTQAIATFDDIYQQDRFEERALIWKAIVYQRMGDLDKAEATVRQAILVDPSDGGTPHGKRMLAYQVLSDILAKKGKTADSKLYASVVAAIRLSEKADDYLEAGLQKQALEMYSNSLKLFDDAYCIQSRLAVNLAKEGKMAEAVQHFQRAFELMPSSFGRVETHCFGCEGVFTTGPAESVAERVLQDAAKKDPKKAQSQYLLGYLRKEQGRDAEAATYFWNAVTLDPDYLNAWKELYELGASSAMSIANKEKVIINILRLDPRGRHVPLTTIGSSMHNLANAYGAFAQARLATKDTGPLFALEAAKKRLASPEARENKERFGWIGQSKTPGERLMLIEPVSHLVLNN